MILALKSDFSGNYFWSELSSVVVVICIVHYFGLYLSVSVMYFTKYLLDEHTWLNFSIIPMICAILLVDILNYSSYNKIEITFILICSIIGILIGIISGEYIKNDVIILEQE